VTAGAAALKGVRLGRAGLERDLGTAMAAGAAAALAVGLSARGAYRRTAAEGSYAPLAAYRIAFGAAALAAGSTQRA
jgi:hypothetical protein